MKCNALEKYFRKGKHDRERERERCIKKCDDEKPAATPALTEKKEKQNAVGKTH